MKRDASTRASALLRKAAGAYDPTRADRDKTRAAIARRLTIGVAAGAAVSAGAKSAVAAPSIAPAAGASAAGAGVAGAAAAGAGAGSVGTGVAVAGGVGLATKVVAALAIFGTVSAGAVGVQRMTSTPKRVPVVVATAPVQAAPTEAANAPTTTTTTTNVDAPVVEAPGVQAAPPMTEAVAIANAPEKQPVREPSEKTTSVNPVDAPVAQVAPQVVPQAPSLQIGAETALLAQAQAALEAHEGERALALLDEYARTYPNGTLTEDRDATRVLALCETGREDEARAKADAFLAAHPRSTSAARVRASCASK